MTPHFESELSIVSNQPQGILFDDVSIVQSRHDVVHSSRAIRERFVSILSIDDPVKETRFRQKKIPKKGEKTGREREREKCG